MKIVLNWLEDYVTLNKGVTVDDLCRVLTDLGHEIDGVSGGEMRFENVVVGRVKERVQHPNADRLGVCQVDVGAAYGGVRQIVCGAPNARAGITVAVALPGAVLPGEFKIGASKIRDVTSDGMICSVRELGLGDEHAGIWELDTDKAVGTPLDDVLGVPPVVLDVAVTPNRGDCLSHLGIARELAAAGLGGLKALPEPVEGKDKGTLTVGTEVADCAVIYGVEMGAVRNVPSPAEVQARLLAAGVKPRGALVDVTNYVMLALGQPLHAYDADKLSGGIVARAGAAGEAFVGLGDVEKMLVGGEVVIASGKDVVGLAGVLGGRESAVSEGTTRVLLEGAYFDRVRTALTGQAHQLHTDARARFERGVDPAMTRVAVLWAAQLVAEWTGGKACAPVMAGAAPAVPAVIQYDTAFCGVYGGLDVAPARQREILEGLGFAVKGKDGDALWAVTPPTWRTYMSTPEDLVEEVLRVVGYANIPSVLPPAMGAQHAIDGAPVLLDRLARKAVALAGCVEVLTYSFIGRKEAERVAPEAKLLELANPLAETSMTTLRPSLLPGLFNALDANMRRQEPVGRLAEVGKVYDARGEKLMAAALLSGAGERHWRVAEAAHDVFAAKALALQVLDTLGAPVGSLVVEALDAAGVVYHPGKSGQLRVGPMVLAKFGEVHPSLRAAYDLKGLKGALAMVEWYLEPLLKLKAKAKTWASQAYPAVKRDVALVLPLAVKAADVQTVLAGVDKALIAGVEVFDRYEGDKVAAGHYSLALALTLQAKDRTLAEADIVPLMEKVVAKAKETFGASLR